MFAKHGRPPDSVPAAGGKAAVNRRVKSLPQGVGLLVGVLPVNLSQKAREGKDVKRIGSAALARAIRRVSWRW